MDQHVKYVMLLDCHTVNFHVPLITEVALWAHSVYSHKLCVHLINAVHLALLVNVSVSFV